MWLFVLACLIGYLCYYIIKAYSYWSKKGIKQASVQRIFYSTLKILFRSNSSFPERLNDEYTKYPNDRYFGMYQLLLPVLVIKDLELIKQLTVKDFEHFLDHRSFVNVEIDQLWSNSLFALAGERWKEMRSTLSPAFTSSKMKHMFKLIEESAKQLTQYFLHKDEDFMTVEMKDVCTRFANDVIATTAFGIECDSLKNPNNEFYLAGKQLTDFEFKATLKLLGYFAFPKLLKFFKVQFFSDDKTSFLKESVLQTIEAREKNNIIRQDMLNILLQAKHEGLTHENENDHIESFATVKESEVGRTHKSRKFEITNEIITSQAFSFFFAGFESVSSLMCFASYELALNPEIQEKLHKEIDEIHQICGEDELTYELLLKMKYLDMVISETLRKWPNAAATDRACTKPYTIQPNGPDERPVTLNENDSIWIPIFALHRDPKHYPDPDRFDPERFSDENRHKINPYAYLPFGVGPRACVGSRFALLETKVFFYHLLLHFEIVPVEKTPIPMKLNYKTFTVSSANGYWLGLKRRRPVQANY